MLKAPLIDSVNSTQTSSDSLMLRCADNCFGFFLSEHSRRPPGTVRCSLPSSPVDFFQDQVR